MTLFAFRGQKSRRVGAVICLALFLALQLFASSETLHRAIHRDAGLPQHHCAITLFTQGQVNAADVFLPSLAFIAALIFFLPQFQSASFSSFDYRFSASRAPPVS